MIVGFLQLRQRYPKMALTLKCVKPKQDILLGNIWKKLHQTMKSENITTDLKTLK